MKVSYDEGLALHVVPRVMAVSSRGVVASVDRGRYGLGIEPRNVYSGMPRVLSYLEGNIARCEYGECFCKSRAVGDPMHVLKLLARNPGGLIVGLGLLPRSAWPQ